MNSEERAREIISAIIDICRVDFGDKRPQVEACVQGHLDEIERRAAEKAVAVHRAKATEASDTVLSETAIGSPAKNVEHPSRG
jgi:hypothetical protein